LCVVMLIWCWCWCYAHLNAFGASYRKAYDSRK